MMRVLWTHNFDLTHVNAGAFMRVFAEGLRAQGVELDLHCLGNLRRPDRVLRARAEVARLAPRYDVVHAQFGSACAVATAGVRGTPTVLSLRGSDWYLYRHRLNGEMVHSILGVGMSRWVVRDFDAVIVMSHRMHREVTGAYPGLDVVHLPDPIDLARFRPMEREAARAAVGQAGNRERWVLFTTVSTRNPIKRVPLAMRAVQLADARLGDVRLRVASGLRHDQMPAFVAGCDVALSTSVHEGWPNAIKEALACNVPFVATDVSDLREISTIEPSCQVCPADAEALATALCDVLQRPRPPDVRRHVESMSLESSSRQLISLYERLIARRRTESAAG